MSSSFDLTLWLAGAFGAPVPRPEDKIQVWIAAFAALTALSTVALFLLGLIQIPAIRNAEKKRATIARCEVYDIDPVLNQATLDVFALTKGVNYDYETVAPAAHSLKTIANFFASIAIGIQEGAYDDKIARLSFKENVSAFVDYFIRPEFEQILPAANLRELIELRERWRDTRSRGSKPGSGTMITSDQPA